MLERIVVIGSAAVLAALVFCLTLLSGPATPRAVQRSIDDPVIVDQLPEFDPDRSPGNLNGHGQVKQYRLRSINSRGQLVEMYGDTLTPRPNGVTHVTLPGARLHLAPTRVLDIRAVEGTILAPENRIQSGDFAGEVVLTLFESLHGRPLDLSADSQDADLHVFLQDARFNMELGQLASDQSIHLTGPRIDFHGEGLDLTYNDLRHRIDRLTVTHGRSLRIKPNPPTNHQNERADAEDHEESDDSQPPVVSEPLSQTLEDESTETDDETVESAAHDHADGPDTAPHQTDAPPLQYYRARFESQVRIRRYNTIIEADRLEIVFSLGAKGLPKSAVGHGRIDTHQFAARSLMAGQTHWAARTFGALQQFTWLGMASKLPFPEYRSPRTMLARLAALAITQTITATSAVNKNSGPIVDPEDVMITWAGRLLIEPEESPPIDLSGDNDVLVQLVGRPVRIETGNQEVISAASVDYLTSAGRIRIIGSDRHPFEMRSRTLGILRGEKLIIDQAQGTGQVLGSGSLRPALASAETKKAADPLDTFQTDDSQNKLAGVQITWEERVDLLFDESVQHTTGGDYSAGQITAVKDATFRGKVRVKHPQIDLACESIHVSLRTGESNRPTADTIEAKGDVIATIAHKDPLQSIAIHSDQLTVELTEDDFGRTIASQIVAAGGVQTGQGPRTMRADRLEISLKQSKQGERATEDGDKNLLDDLDVETIVADPSSVDLSQQSTSQEEDSLAASPKSPTLFLAPLANPLEEDATEPLHVDRFDSFAASWTIEDSDDPVIVIIPFVQASATDATTPVTPDSLKLEIESLTATGDVSVDLEDLDVHVTSADRLLVDIQADQVEIFGSDQTPACVQRPDGRLTAQHIVAHPSGQAVHVSGPGTVTFHQGAVGRDAVADRDTRLTVTWTGAMHFDNQYGLAQFVGDVVSDAWRVHEMSKLSAQDLRLEFTHRTIRSATARDDVTFLSSSWSDVSHNHLETRMRVSGPLISFDNVVEQIQVIGPGKMLIEDYRVRSERRKSDPEAATLFGVERTGQVKFTGRGATLMRWSGQLSMDAFHNDLRADSDVQMIHRSLDSQLTVQMDCQRFVADLANTGGLGVWFGNKAPQPQIQAVYADESVRVLSDDRTIITDHLEYTGFDQSILLRADPGRLTQIQEEGQPTALTAERFRWDLPANRLVVLKPGPGRVPLR